MQFQVVSENFSTPLLGKRASEAIKLIKVNYENIIAKENIIISHTPWKEQWTLEQIKTQYADVFTGDGCLDGLYQVEVDESIKPVQLPKRCVPLCNDETT